MWGGVKQQNKSAEAGRRPLEQSATVRVISPEDHLQLYMYAAYNRQAVSTLT